MENLNKKVRIIRRIMQMFSILTLVLVALLVFQVLRMGILPLKLSIPLLAAILLFTVLIMIFYHYQTRKLFSKIICGIIVLVMFIGYGVGNFYIFKTSSMFSDITNLTSNMKNTVSVVTLADSSITDVNELDQKQLGIVSNLDSDGTSRALADIEKKANVQQVDYQSLIELVNALYDGQVDAILLNESYRGEVHDMDMRANFNTETKVIHTTEYYTQRTNEVSASHKPVDVTADAFTILISGNDSYGSLNETSRSDSNMLVTINPTTHTILLTSIPRDYYLTMACGDGASTSCPASQDDKLTHTGLFGVSTTISTIEENTGIDINYYARVNFSSLVNLVDALDGIDIEVPEGMEVESFYANSTLEGVEAGTNHLDGERALAYARERHAYIDGDAQRVKNQQQVLEAIFDKATSPSMIMNYPKFVDAISGAFETNLTNSDIISLIRFQLSMSPSWTFESYSMTGESSSKFCATLGDNASVTVPDTSSVQIAAAKVKAVLQGKSSADVDVEATEPTVEQEPDVPTEDYSYEQSYENPSWQDQSQEQEFDVFNIFQ